MSYWLFSLVGAAADVILVLLTAALVFIYLLLRGTPIDLRVRRSGGSGRSSRPGRRESGAGQPGGAAARQITAGPGSVAAKPGTTLLADTFDWFVPPHEPADESTPWQEGGFVFSDEPKAEPADESASRGARQETPQPVTGRVALATPPERPRAPLASGYPAVPRGDHTRLAEVYQVLPGGERIRVTLAEDEAPELVTDLVAPNGRLYRHHLVWASLPGDTPEGGIAFACLGSSDRGALFLDLGQAPSAVTIGGDLQAVARLTESIAHQLCAASDDTGYTVVIIGDALPRPHPPTATWLAGVDRLGSALAAHPGRVTAIVFCRLGTAADAQTLTDHVTNARCRVVPVVLNGPVEGPWSITATPVAEASGTV